MLLMPLSNRTAALVQGESEGYREQIPGVYRHVGLCALAVIEEEAMARMKIIIAGGGIGGMALALSFHDGGMVGVGVSESSSAVKELGVGINVLPHAVRELTELGLLDELDACGIPTAELAYYSKHGQRIWAEPRGLAAGYRWPQFS